MVYVIIAIVAAFIGGVATGLMARVLTPIKETVVEDHSIYMETIAIDENTIY